MADHFANLVPWRADDVRVLEAKILIVLTGGGAAGVTTGGVAAGTADPNTLGLALTVQIYNQFDGSNNFVQQWQRTPAGTFV